MSRYLIGALALTIVGCTGSKPSANSTIDPITGVKSMELTSPWKGMDLPIDGAIVEFSGDRKLRVRHPTLGFDMVEPTYSVLRERLVANGWSPAMEKVRGAGSSDVKATGYFDLDNAQGRLYVLFKNDAVMSYFDRIQIP